MDQVTGASTRRPVQAAAAIPDPKGAVKFGDKATAAGNKDVEILV